MTLLAALCAAVAAWLWMRGPEPRRLLAVSGPGAGPESVRAVRRRVLQHWAPHRRVLERQARRRVVLALGALAAELRAGQPAGAALHLADPDGGVWPTASQLAGVGGDVVVGLQADAHADEWLRALAACWAVSAQSGAGLESAVGHLAESARDAEEVRDQLAVQLAGPRATARVLAALPILGIAMSQLAGADAIGWLTGSPAGLACLVIGVGLDVVGFLWTDRMARKLEEEL